MFEWRDDEPTGVELSAIEQKINELEGKVSAESDAQKCAAALAVVNDTPRLLGVSVSHQRRGEKRYDDSCYGAHRKREPLGP